MSAVAAPHARHDAADDGALLEVQFDDLRQQHTTSMLGMWTFLATEVMFFAGLVGAYIIYRTIYRQDFAAAGQHLDVIWGGINTVVLLTSSLTMALAVHYAQLGRVRLVPPLLIATMVLGTAFLGVKAKEWSHDYHVGLVPFFNAWNWEKAERLAAEEGHAPHGEAVAGGHEPTGGEPGAAAGKPGEATAFSTFGGVLPDARSGKVLPVKERSVSDRAKLFFTFYFFMTGLHALHMVIGVVLVGIITALSWRRWLSGNGETQIEVTGLYWHFVDIVWVYLYPALYLIDIHR